MSDAIPRNFAEKSLAEKSLAEKDFADLLLRPRDPILLRDGRPFAAEPGARARTLPWPMPHTVAGALRTHAGEALNFDWKADGPERARALHLRGPLLATWDGAEEWQVLVPAPRDAVFFEPEKGKPDLMCLRPLAAVPDGAGTLSPSEGLRPLEVTEERKPRRDIPTFWTLGCVTEWLSAARPMQFDPVGALPIPTETRTFVKIDEGRQTGETGMLYSADLLCFADFPAPGSAATPTPTPAQALLCRLRGAGALAAGPQFLPLGGERRLATVSAADGAIWPQTADYPGLTAVLTGKMRLRLQLVTPALFAGGWKPWREQQLTGEMRAVPGLRLTLVAAAVGRLAPVSGWDLQTRKPKPLRYAAPAGSVYFFEVEDEGGLTAAQIAALFLQPVNDAAADDADGFGLALPGVW